MEEKENINELIDSKKNEEIMILNLNKRYDLVKKENKVQIIIEKKKEIEKINPYYKINEEKLKELESIFKADKTKINLSNPFFLENEKIIGKLGDKYIILDKRDYNILFEIKNSYEIKGVIELENHDLIFLTISSRLYEYVAGIFIYRLKVKKYTLFQTIKEKNEYEQQYILRGFMAIEKDYIISEIKKLSKNRFIIISNYGFKIYSLNEKEEYSLILIEKLQGIQQFYEINEFNFIFCLKDNEFIYEKEYDVNLLEIYAIKIEKITEVQKLDHFRFLKPNENKNKILSSLQYTFNLVNSYYENCKFDTYSFDDILIDNNKYYIINKNNHLYIFNTKLELLHKYEFFNEDHNPRSFNITKYDSNILILYKNGQVSLIEIENNNSKGENDKNPFNFKIIAYSYFPGIQEIGKRTQEKKFYQIKKIGDKDFIILY